MAMRNYVLPAIVAAVLMQSAPAFAHDDDDDDDHQYGQDRSYEYRSEHHHYYGRAPRTVIVEREIVYPAPPAIVYQPAPAVVYEYGAYDEGRAASLLFGAALGAYLGHVMATGR
jgi:hypothetical protein